MQVSLAFIPRAEDLEFATLCAGSSEQFSKVLKGWIDENPQTKVLSIQYMTSGGFHSALITTMRTDQRDA